MYVCSYFDSSTDKGTRKEWLREHELSFVGSYFASIDNSMHFSSIAPWSHRCCASFSGKNLSTVITIVSEAGIVELRWLCNTTRMVSHKTRFFIFIFNKNITIEFNIPPIHKCGGGCAQVVCYVSHYKV